MAPIQSRSQVDWFVEKGKQVGITKSKVCGTEVRWLSLGVQQWGGQVLVYVNETLESQMARDEHEREELIAFPTLQEARDFIGREVWCDYSELRPCKGQRLFNPELLEAMQS